MRNDKIDRYRLQHILPTILLACCQERHFIIRLLNIINLSTELHCVHQKGPILSKHFLIESAPGFGWNVDVHNDVEEGAVGFWGLLLSLQETCVDIAI